MSLLLFLLLVIPPCIAAAEQVVLEPPARPDDLQPSGHEFKLQHIFHHGVGPVSHIHRRLDITENDSPLQLELSTEEAKAALLFPAVSIPIDILRLSDRRLSTVEPLLDYAFQTNSLSPYDVVSWSVDKILGPKIDDKQTIISLAQMSLAAYIAPFTQTNTDDLSSWSDISPSISPNRSIPIGWESIGLRGQVFVSETKDIVIIALKGTSPPYYPGPKETTDLDRENDNLLFSCCCGDSKYLYNPVCACSSRCSSSSKCPIPSPTSSTTPTPFPGTEPFGFEAVELETKGHTCNKTCQIENLKSPDRYWSAAREIYTNISLLYPDSQIWLTGHSLGGAMASLVGTAYGLPVITFEAPGEAAAARRLSLPLSPSNPNFIHHIGHTADPIFTGSCNSFLSSCQIAGYFFETKCHTGYTCTYDTVGDLGWISWIGNHRLPVVIEGVLGGYESVVECVAVDSECVDCGGWGFYD